MADAACAAAICCSSKLAWGDRPYWTDLVSVMRHDTFWLHATENPQAITIDMRTDMLGMSYYAQCQCTTPCQMRKHRSCLDDMGVTPDMLAGTTSYATRCQRAHSCPQAFLHCLQGCSWDQGDYSHP